MALLGLDLAFPLEDRDLIVAPRVGGRWAFGDCNLDVLYAVVFYGIEVAERRLGFQGTIALTFSMHKIAALLPIS